MKLRVPLYAQFVGWFFLNLVLLAVCSLLFLRSQLKVDRLLAALVGERAQPVAESLIQDLRSRPISQWTDELDRYSRIHGVRFQVVRISGDVLAGAKSTLPAEVIEVLARRPANRPPHGRGGPPGMEGFDGMPPDRLGDFPPPDGPHPPRRGGDGLAGFVHSGNPGRYWLLVDAMLPDPEQHRPTFLSISSDQLSGGGFFFNSAPWLWAGSAVILVSVLWWLPFVGQMTRSISQMTRATERIAEGNFEIAVHDQRGDELGRLGTAINQMSTRLGGFVLGQKRFLGDVAHELCSPLARMEMALGILDQRADARSKEYVQDVREEVRHMSGLVNELLSFSKASLRQRDLPLETVALLPLVTGAVDRESPPEGAVRIDIAEDLLIEAAPDLLARAIGNLVRNALRYAAQAGPITLSAARSGSRVQVIIADLGPGVTPESLARLGEPFYRPDAARTREDGGAGLGLAIVRSCIDACHGTVHFRNRTPSGFEAEIQLQLAVDSAPG